MRVSLAREGSRAAPRRLFDAYYRGAVARRDGGGDGDDDDVENGGDSDNNDVDDGDEESKRVGDGVRAGMTSALSRYGR